MLGTNILPVWVGMLVLLGVVVTFTRTGGAVLLTASSALSHDIYVKLLRPAAGEGEKLIAARSAVVLVAILPVVIALGKLDLVNFVVLFSARLHRVLLLCSCRHRPELEARHASRRPLFHGRRSDGIPRVVPIGAPVLPRYRSGRSGARGERLAVCRREPGDEALARETLQVFFPPVEPVREHAATAPGTR